MRILFCKIAHMKCYKGADNDPPRNGGSSAEKGEVNNFKVITDETGKKILLGFVETKSKKKRKKPNELHIEKIKGCELLKGEKSVDDVLVVWFATADTNECVVVGWYKHATVYRRYENMSIYDEVADYDYIQYYNIKADYENCVLLPDNGTRRRWELPKTFTFGETLVRYPTGEKDEKYLKKLVQRINNYNGENWIDKYPDEVDVIKI